MAGSLTIVGTGIKFGAHVTVEGKGHIQAANKIFYLMADPASEEWICSLGQSPESLAGFYEPGKSRIESYKQMVSRILTEVRKGVSVCVVLYGHPGVFVFAAHEAIRQAKQEGFHAEMLPGISAEDCLFADLGFDPGRSGCQSYEATDFLIHERRFDNTSALVLWQISQIGNREFCTAVSTHSVSILIDYLSQFYPPDHKVIVYEASQYPLCAPVIVEIALESLIELDLTALSTLYVPPLPSRRPSAQMLAKLHVQD